MNRYARIALLFVIALLSIGYATALTNNTPTAYYSFNTSLLLDDTGNGNSLTETGTSTQWVTGLAGNASRFFADNDELQSPVYFNGTNAMSFSAWINPNATNGMVMGQDNGGTYRSWYVYYSSTSKIEFQVTNTAGTNVAATTTATYGTGIGWIHVCGAYDGSNVWLRVNGTTTTNNSASGTLGFGTATSGAIIGNRDQSLPFAGDIDEVAWWVGEAITARDCDDLYNSGFPLTYPFTPASGLDNFTVTAQDAYTASSITGFNVTFDDLGITTTQTSYNHTTDYINALALTNSGAQYNSSKHAYDFWSSGDLRSSDAKFFVNESFTVCADVYVREFTLNSAFLFRRVGSYGAGYMLRIDSGSKFGFTIEGNGGDAAEADSDSGLSVGRYFVCGTRNETGGTLGIFTNGDYNEIADTTTTVLGVVGDNFELGTQANIFNGTIYRAYVINETLDVDDMNRLWNYTAVDTEWVARYEFINFSTEPSTFDYSGQGTTISTYQNITYNKNNWFEFDNTANSYFNITPKINLGTSDFTISFWYKFSETAGTQPRIFRTTGNSKDNEIYFNTNTMGWRLVLDNGSSNTDNNRCETNFNNTAWQHVLFTVDRNGNTQCYINASASGSPNNIASLTGDLTSGNTNNLFGTTSAGWFGNAFNGSLTQFRIYGEVLNSSEITAVYNNESINANAWYILTAQNSSIGDVTVNGIPNYFGNTTNNVNTSQTLTTKHTRHPFVLFYDAYTGLNISSFNVTINATTYTTTNGTLYIPYKDLVGTSSANKYFQSSNTISNRTEYLAHYASITGFNAYDKVSGANVSTFTVNTTSEGGSATNNSYLPSLYTTYGNFTAELNKGGYYQSFTTYEANPQTSQTANFTVYNHKANFTINIGIGGSTDQNFTITIYDRNNYSYTETRNTTTGSITFNLSHGNFTAYINDSIHTLTNYNFTLNNGNNLSNFTITTYTTNTVNITFLDEETNRLITQADQNSTVTAYITGSAASYNFTTNTGSIQAEMINPQSYVVTYSADGYGQREKHFTLTNRTYEYLTLYLLNESSEDLILFTVRDAIGTNIENATVRAQRKNLSGTNYYEVDNCVTGTEGTCTMRLILYDPTYRFVVDYNDATVKTTGDQKITSTSVVITVDLTTDELAQIKSNLDVTGNVTYNNNTETFTFTWNNPAGTNVQGCMEVTARKAGIYTTLNNTNCGTSSSGSVTYTINESRYDEFTAKGYVTSDGITRLVDTYGLITGGFGTGAGANGLFIFGFFILGTLAMAMLWNPIAAPIVLVGGLALFSFAGIISIPLASIGGLIALVIGFIALSNR